jgi:hypothetical protein
MTDFESNGLTMTIGSAREGDTGMDEIDDDDDKKR